MIYDATLPRHGRRTRRQPVAARVARSAAQPPPHVPALLPRPPGRRDQRRTRRSSPTPSPAATLTPAADSDARPISTPPCKRIDDVFASGRRRHGCVTARTDGPRLRRTAGPTELRRSTPTSTSGIPLASTTRGWSRCLRSNRRFDARRRRSRTTPRRCRRVVLVQAADSHRRHRVMLETAAANRRVAGVVAWVPTPRPVAPPSAARPMGGRADRRCPPPCPPRSRSRPARSTRRSTMCWRCSPTRQPDLRRVRRVGAPAAASCRRLAERHPRLDAGHRSSRQTTDRDRRMATLGAAARRRRRGAEHRRQAVRPQHGRRTRCLDRRLPARTSTMPSTCSGRSARCTAATGRSPCSSANSYTEIWRELRGSIDQLEAASRWAVLAGNAQRVYRLTTPVPTTPREPNEG